MGVTRSSQALQESDRCRNSGEPWLLQRRVVRRISGSIALGIGFAHLLALLGCSGSDTQQPEQTLSETKGIPPLPADCTQPIPTAQMKTSEVGRIERLQVHKGTIYFATDKTRSVHSIRSLGEEPTVVATLAKGSLSDFWVDDDGIRIASRGALYKAAFDGGQAQLVPGYQPDPDDSYVGYEYAREGDYLYYWPPYPASDVVIRRAPLAGGPPEKVELPAEEWTRGSFAPGHNHLFFLAADDSDAGLFTRIMSVSPGSTEPALVHRQEIAQSIVFADSLWIFLHRHLMTPGHPGLWRISDASDPQPTPVSVPENGKVGIMLSSRVRANSVAVSNGVHWFMASGWYSVPDDRRLLGPALAVREVPGQDRVELARCIPEPEYSPLTPKVHRYNNPVAIAGDDSGVYIVTSVADWEHPSERIVRVSP